MRAVIGVINVARGVGKTTTAVSLAAELALRGFEPILIDADPQAEATARRVNTDGVRLSVADLLLAPEPPPACARRGGAPRTGGRAGADRRPTPDARPVLDHAGRR